MKYLPNFPDHFEFLEHARQFLAGPGAVGCDNSGHDRPAGDRPTPASGAATFNQWLAGGCPPSSPACWSPTSARTRGSCCPPSAPPRPTGCGKAPKTPHGPLIQRWFTPILVLAYTAFLVVIAAVPDLPLVWQVTVPAVLFTAVALTAARSYGYTGVGPPSGSRFDEFVSLLGVEAPRLKNPSNRTGAVNRLGGR